MSEKKQKSRQIKKSDAIKQLTDDLVSLDPAIKDLSEAAGEEEMLSLIVEEASKGIDISIRYPTFYKRLLKNPDLMHAFLDVLESIEEEEKNQQLPWTSLSEVKLDFLADSTTKPTIERLDDRWRISLQRTVAQLQAIFSDSGLAYRSELSVFEDPWFVLLRDEIEIDGSIYTVALECTFLSEEDTDALIPFLNLAVTVGIGVKRPLFPILTSLQWGTYSAKIQISDEGRARFPNIPLLAMFDEQYEKVNAELNLSIEPTA